MNPTPIFFKKDERWFSTFTDNAFTRPNNYPLFIWEDEDLYGGTTYETDALLISKEDLWDIGHSMGMDETFLDFKAYLQRDLFKCWGRPQPYYKYDTYVYEILSIRNIESSIEGYFKIESPKSKIQILFEGIEE